MSNEIELTEQGKAIEKMVNDWAQGVPGLLLDQSETGEANGAVLQKFISVNRLPFTPESLNTAVRLAQGLTWTSGFGPQGALAPAPAAPAVTPRKKDRFNDGIDSGQGAPQRDPTDTHAWRAANKVDTTKLFEDRQAAEAARQKAASDEQLRYDEENVKIFKAGDRLDYGATEAAQKAAREKWAKIRGVKIVPSSIAAIPLESTIQDLKKYNPDQIKHWMRRRREAGLPV